MRTKATDLSGFLPVTRGHVEGVLPFALAASPHDFSSKWHLTSQCFPFCSLAYKKSKGPAHHEMYEGPKVRHING